MKNILTSVMSIFILLMFSAGFVNSADFTPQGNINLRGVYNITGAPFVNATIYYGNGSQLTGVVATGPHNSLASIQGGAVAEYYHLNQSEHTSVLAGIISWITSWLVPDQTSKYIYNDSTTIYFNETNLNATGDNRWVNEDGDIMTGDLNFSNSRIIDPNSVQFNITFTDGTAEGRLQWNIDDGTLEVGMPGGSVNLQIGQENLIRSTNKEGATITNGQVVYISGANGAFPEIKVSSNDNVTKARVIGVATEDILNNQKGYVTIFGLVRDINTSAVPGGGIAWLGVDGSITATRPTSPTSQIAIGIVLNSHATVGILYVNPLILQQLSQLSDVFPSAKADNSILFWNGSSLRHEYTNNPELNNITIQDSIIQNGYRLTNLSSNAQISGDIFAMMMTGPSSVELPHLYVQPGGSGQFSGMVRTWGIVDERIAFLNNTNRTDCQAYFDIINETLKIDCNTTTTGADFFVSDDSQFNDEVWMKDTDGEWHFMTRELEWLDEQKDETLINRINTTTTGTNVTIESADGKTLIVNFKEVNYDLGIIEDSVLITNGTNSSPQFNHVYYSNGASPTLTANTAEQEEVANVLKGIYGSAGYDYGSYSDNAKMYELNKGMYERLWDEGAIYISGFDIDASTLNINFTQGVLKIITDRETVSSHDTDDGFNHIHSDGEFHQHTNFDGLDEYATGEAVGNNKFFNVVFGVTHTEDDVGHIYAVVQNLAPAGEYVTLVSAETDTGNTLNFFPNDDFIKQIYIPVARGVMQNSGGTMTLQTLSSGELFIDIRGQVTTTAGSSPSPGITVHSDLTNLDEASSGHTGFLAADGSDALTANWGQGAFNLTDTDSWFLGKVAAATIQNPIWRLQSWNNFTGIPTATPSNGDTTHLSTADQIFDWAVGLFLQDVVDDTTPQLGGYLDANANNIGATDDEIENIYVGTNTRIYFGDGQEGSMYYNGTNLIISG